MRKWVTVAGCLCFFLALGAVLQIQVEPKTVNHAELMESAVSEGQDAAGETYPATVTSAGLALRQKPSRKAQALGEYYSGVQVQVVAHCDDVKWAQVQIGQAEGYMEADRLAVGQAALDVPSIIHTVTLASNTSSQHVQLRKEPSDQAMSLGRYPDGTTARVLGIAGEWYHVEVNGKTGYMLAQLLISE